VLGSSGEVAVADSGNHCVQIFDREGNCKRHFSATTSGSPSWPLMCPATCSCSTRPIGCRCSVPRACAS
jgi:hypothetical protein